MRVGPRMAAVVAYVAAHPWCVMGEAARHVAPGRNGRVGLGYGYRSVHRAIKAGLVIAERRDGRSMVLATPAHVGLRVVSGPTIEPPVPACYGDGAFGHQHTRECAADMLEYYGRLRGGISVTGVGPTLEALRGDMSDDAGEEYDAEDYLNEYAPLEGYWWGWRGGDFGLWPEVFDE